MTYAIHCQQAITYLNDKLDWNIIILVAHEFKRYLC